MSNSPPEHNSSRQHAHDNNRKYIGYPGFVAHVCSDDDFFVLRRFDNLHSRILLRLQDSLAVLEERLDAADSALSAKEATDVDNGSFRSDQAERRALLEVIEAKLNSYGMHTQASVS